MTAPAPATRRAVEYGALPIASLAMVLALQTGELSSLGLAVEGIKDEFHVSDLLLGAIPTAMAAVGLFGAIPFGMLADRVRRTWLLAGSMLLWTACMAANGAATSFAFLFIARLGVGGIEASSPAAISLLADYYPVGERAGMLARYQLGGFLGAVLGAVGVGQTVEHGGWEWAFYTWIPFGLVAAFLLMRCPEPARGQQELDYGSDLATAGGLLATTEQSAELEVDEELLAAERLGHLPPPRRVGTVDYSTLKGRAVLRELLHIPTMWFGVISITVAQLLLAALAQWGVPYFQRVHHLSTGNAGLVSAVLAIGAAGGIMVGGAFSDRVLRRGWINGRVWLIAGGSVGATGVLVPAFLSTHLLVTAPLFLLGGFLVTLPIAPSEAMVADVVVGELRGRAATVRAIVRTGSAFGPFIVGGLIDLLGIRVALAAFTPIYGLGGLLVLLALRSYGSDLSFVLAEAKRTQGGVGVAA